MDSSELAVEFARVAHVREVGAINVNHSTASFRSKSWADVVESRRLVVEEFETSVGPINAIHTYLKGEQSSIVHKVWAWGSWAHNSHSRVEKSSDDSVAKLAMRNYSVLRHVLEPSTCHRHKSASSDNTRMRLHVLDDAVLVIVELYTRWFVVVVGPRLYGVMLFKRLNCYVCWRVILKT